MGCLAQYEWKVENGKLYYSPIQGWCWISVVRGNLSNAQGFGQLDQSSNLADKRSGLEEGIYMNNWADLLVDQRLEE